MQPSDVFERQPLVTTYLGDAMKPTINNSANSANSANIVEGHIIIENIDPSRTIRGDFTGCVNKGKEIIQQHLFKNHPEIRGIPEEVERRLESNILALMGRGYDTPEKIQSLIDNCLYHDTVSACSKAFIASAPGNVANFMGMHDTKLLGLSSALTSSQLGLALGAIIAAVDILGDATVNGAFGDVRYHKTDPDIVKKLIDPNYTPPPQSAKDLIGDLGQNFVNSIVKNSLRLPVAGLAGLFSGTEGLVNKNNVQVTNPDSGEVLSQPGTAGLADNIIDSFAPHIIKPVQAYLSEKQLAEKYSASMLLQNTDTVEKMIDRTEASWGDAIKNGVVNMVKGAGKGVYNAALHPQRALVANLATIAVVAKFVENVVHTNGGIQSEARAAYMRDHPNSTFINNGTLTPGWVPTGSWVESRANSVSQFALMSVAAPVVAKVTQLVVDAAVQKGQQLWDQYKGRNSEPVLTRFGDLPPDPPPHMRMG